MDPPDKVCYGTNNYLFAQRTSYIRQFFASVRFLLTRNTEVILTNV